VGSEINAETPLWGTYPPDDATIAEFREMMHQS